MTNYLIGSPSSSPSQNSNSTSSSTEEGRDQQLTLASPITDPMKGYTRHFATHVSEQIWNVFKWARDQRTHG